MFHKCVFTFYFLNYTLCRVKEWNGDEDIKYKSNWNTELSSNQKVPEEENQVLIFICNIYIPDD